MEFIPVNTQDTEKSAASLEGTDPGDLMHKCPRCDREMIGAFRRGHRLYLLNPGDIIGCRNCGAILIVNDDHSEREPTKEEFKKIRSDPETWKRVVKTMAETIRFLRERLGEEAKDGFCRDTRSGPKNL